MGQNDSPFFVSWMAFLSLISRCKDCLRRRNFVGVIKYIWVLVNFSSQMLALIHGKLEISVFSTLIASYSSFFFESDICDVPLGMQDGRITPSMLTASSMINHYYGPWSARLRARNHGSMRGGWVAKYRNTNQWLQIDLGVKSRVKRICTQGRYDANQYVKSYTVSFSTKGDKFVPYKEGRKIRVCYCKKPCFTRGFISRLKTHFRLHEHKLVLVAFGSKGTSNSR